MRHCTRVEFTSFTTFACKDEPTYILTRQCTDEYYVASGICCKFDEGINFVAENHILFQRTKYLIQSDDDVFWRLDQVTIILFYFRIAITAASGSPFP